MNTQAIVKVSKKLGRALDQRSPEIFTGLAVGGLVTTFSMAISATHRMDSELNDMGSLTLDDYDPKEKAMLIAKYYGPAIAMGLLTIASIVGSNAISRRRSAALASLYALSEKTLREYQEKVIETIGKNKEQRLSDDIVQDKLNANPVGNVVVFAGTGNTLCCDAYSGRYFKSDMESLRAIQNTLNKAVLNDSYITLNDLYYAIGLPAVELGGAMGWSNDQTMLNFIFTTKIADTGEPCLVVKFQVHPRYFTREHGG